jgi:hypothetical protein
MMRCVYDRLGQQYSKALGSPKTPFKGLGMESPDELDCPPPNSLVVVLDSFAPPNIVPVVL